MRNPAHSPDSFAREYFPDSRIDIAQRVHRTFLETAPFDAQRAHPDDKLVDDLRFDDFDSMATVDFVLALEEEFEMKLPDAEMANARTLRDIIDFIFRQTPTPSTSRADLTG